MTQSLTVFVPTFGLLALFNVEHLGDGVYSGVDPTGQFWLATQRDTGWHAIALEPATIYSLVDTYLRAIKHGMARQPD